MEITDELLERFFNDACNVEETEAVSVYLKEHPGVLEKYANKKEWDEIEMQQHLPASDKEEMWQVINEKTRSKIVVLWLKRLSIAACIAGVLFFSYQWISQNNHRHSLAGKLQKDTTQLAAVQHKVLHNISEKEMIVALMDGSVIKLQSHSELRFDEPFQNNRRDIALIGKAFFKVAKDKTKPFIVTAGGLSTTALGTSFWVDENKRLHKINVRLLTGKVVIAKVQGWGIKNFKPVYLNPGQELKFETIGEKYLVQNFGLKNEGLENKNNNRLNKKLNANSDEKIVFNNTPLSEVFKTLEKEYKISISFNKEDCSKITFTGNYKITDSLEDILQTISLLNNLKIERTGSGFSIKK